MKHKLHGEGTEEITKGGDLSTPCIFIYLFILGLSTPCLAKLSPQTVSLYMHEHQPIEDDNILNLLK